MEKAENLCIQCGKVIAESERAYVVENGLICIDCDKKLPQLANAFHGKEGKKTSIWAKISFFSALSAWGSIILSFCLYSISPQPVGPGTKILKLILAFLSGLLIIAMFPAMFIAFLSAVIGSIRIIVKKDTLKGWGYIIAGFCLLFLFSLGFFLPALGSVKRMSNEVACGGNMSYLSKVILLYSQDNDGRYPTADIWCDLILQNNYAYGEEIFVCKVASKRSDMGRCHYALNPNCSPNSPPDTVLLFETAAGWNQHGGPELLAAERYKRNGRKVCNVSFNDGHVDFVEAENLNKLNWNNKPKDSPNQ